ncbi:MAG: hypothetical protein GY696_00930 [Gammaproteobacteria bacterium]|nr:hypothetical protein [Gammaproteobacteria bacterium]
MMPSFLEPYPVAEAQEMDSQESNDELISEFRSVFNDFDWMKHPSSSANEDEESQVQSPINLKYFIVKEPGIPQKLKDEEQIQEIQRMPQKMRIQAAMDQKSAAWVGIVFLSAGAVILVFASLVFIGRLLLKREVPSNLEKSSYTYPHSDIKLLLEEGGQGDRIEVY